MLPLFLSLLTFASADAPLTVLPPPSASFTITSGSPPKTPDRVGSAAVSLEVGKFVWLSKPDYTGEITYDFSADGPVTYFVVKTGEEYPGWLQGERRGGKHKSPQSPSDVLWVGGEEPGIVTVAAWGNTGPKSKPIKLAVLTITVGGARPPPVPVPPGPAPTGEAAWVVVIEETGARTVETAKILGDLKYWQGIGAKGHEWRHYDKDSPNVPAGYFKGDKLPILLIVSKDGTPLHRGPLPSSKDELSALIASVTGVK